MIQQSLFETDMLRTADFSACRTWRYSLTRCWVPDDLSNPAKMVAFIGLNPSTADERLDDNTISRCVSFAKRWGYSGLFMLNAYGFRSTDPKGLLRTADPIGPGNDQFIQSYASKVNKVVLAWGVHCDQDRARQVRSLIGRDSYCFGKNQDGSPKHPLYLRKESELIIFE